MTPVTNGIDDVHASAPAEHVHEQDLERLVDEVNRLDTVQVHHHPLRCGARFTSWLGEVFLCLEPHGHGYLHRMAATRRP